ncbi:putative ABC transport system permease protein [Filimonas zeae]|uniref:ABC transporter permease n=1 Tax=Filimonas zeae TaxID=1737353 RepID=A0A917MRU6_9BACT|nr:ABC transporter permease [Filimonas zeae]MDR6337804.1 putative ABC transport system permease protein [Filimonas zeae]GGH60344.1 ABC transporter permease [Filimonas zeae]
MNAVFLKTAWRSLWKNKFYTGINLLGLAAATLAFLLLVNYVQFERSYEHFHEKADNIYRLTLDMYRGNEKYNTDCETYPPLGPMLKSNYPEVVDYVRLQDMGTYEMKGPDKSLRASATYAADPSVFTVFNFPLLKGDARTALNTPGQVVISARTAKAMFGSTDIIGKTLALNGQPAVISGVMADIPANTHLRFDLLLPIAELTKMGWDLNTWGGNNNYTYVLTKPHLNLAEFNEKLKALSKARLQNEYVVAQAVKDIHLYSHKNFEPDINGDATVINYILIVAFLIILIGAANYINLTTAHAAGKKQEAGLRKILGASRFNLTRMFFAESLLINLLAMVLALVFTAIMRPFYASLVGYPSAALLFRTPTFWITTLLLFIVNCILSGVYPALVLSAVKTAAATARQFTGSLKGAALRKVLVVGQFTVALIVLSAAVIVYQQMYYVKHRQLGMNIEKILVMRGPELAGTDSVLAGKGKVFKNQLLQVKGVEQVAMTVSLPGLQLSSLCTQTDVHRQGSTENTGFNYYLYGVDENFVPLMNMQLVAGENYRAGSQHNQLLLNEEACRVLGFANAADAIGQKLDINSGCVKNGTITGVIKNYHQQSLKQAQIPVIHWYHNAPCNYISIKVNAENLHQTMAAVENTWNSAFPDHVLEYFFLDDMFNQQYKSDLQFGKIINFFSFFTLFITCLGLLGLTAFSIAKRSKEISIRKVLGASAQSIIALLSKDFLLLILIAIVIAVPVCWYAMHHWLQSFSYRISINGWIFVLTGIAALLLALLTIGLQAARAAMANPSQNLKSE